MVASPADKWLHKVTQHEEHGEHKDVLADTSEGNLDFITSKLQAFYDASGLDPLSDPRSAVIKVFFDFVGENGTVQLVSLQTYFRRFKQLYRRSSNSDLDKAVCKDVNAVRTFKSFSDEALIYRKYLKHHLQGQKPSCPREKAVPTALDFTEMLRFHYGGDTTFYPDERQRVQQAFLMMVMAYSALRPSSTTAARKRKWDHSGGGGTGRHKSRKRDGNITGARAGEQLGGFDREETDESAGELTVPEARLKYGDFRVFLVCNETGETRLCIQPKYKHYKGEKRRRQQKTFTFWTQPNVTHCPAAHLIALGLHDGAFKDPLLTSVQSLLSLQVLPTDQLELYWSEDCENRCILRESTIGEPDKELSADKARYRLRRLGENKGSRKRFIPYSLRMLNLNSLDKGASEEIRNQVAGHLDSRIYRNHYIDPNIEIDTANMVLRRPTEEHLTVALNSMGAGADPRVNRPLSQAERDCIEAMPDLAALTDRRRETYDAINICEDEDVLLTLQEQRSQLTRNIRALRQRYQREHREGYFRRKNEAIVRMQLHGVESDAITAGYQEEYVPRWKTRLPERAYLARLEAKDSPWISDDLSRWAEGLQALKDLCGRMEPRTNAIEDHSRESESMTKSLGYSPPSLDGTKFVSGEHGGFPYWCLPTQCLFCLGNDRLVEELRKKQWEPTHVLWRHVRTQHFKGQSSDDEWRCPHPICQARQVTLKNKAHFLNHAQSEHNIRLQKTA